MSISPTKVSLTLTTLRPIWASMPVIVTGIESGFGAAFTRRTSSTRVA